MSRLLLRLERDRGRRLAAAWLDLPSGAHALRIGEQVERSGEWTWSRWSDVPPSEVFLLHDAIGVACGMAEQVRR